MGSSWPCHALGNPHMGTDEVDDSIFDRPSIEVVILMRLDSGIDHGIG